MRRPDEDHRFHYRLFRAGPDHQPSQADVRRGQASSGPDRLSVSPDSCRGGQ